MKDQKQTRTTFATWIKRFMMVVLFVALLAPIAFVGSVYYTRANDPFNDWWFDSKIWKAQHDSISMYKTRGKMAYDLKYRVLKPNMTRKQVAQILGPPDAGQDATSLTYYVGYWSGIFNIDEDIFIVEFDKNGRVTESYWRPT